MNKTPLFIGTSDYPDEVSPNMFDLKLTDTFVGDYPRAEITLNKSNGLRQMILDHCGVSEEGATVLMNEIVDTIPDSPVDVPVGEAEFDDQANIVSATISPVFFANTLNGIAGKADMDDEQLKEWYDNNEPLYSGKVSWLQYEDFYKWFRNAGVQIIQNKAQDFLSIPRENWK